MIKVGIVGGTGYTGAELIRLLAGHPAAEVVSVTSRSGQGMLVADIYPHLRGSVDLAFVTPDLNNLKNLGIPIAIILGDKDRLVDLKAVDNFTAMVPSKTYTMNEVGHFSFLEDPLELSKLISEIV